MPRETEQWNQRLFEDLFSAETASPKRLADGSILASGKAAVVAVEECAGDIVRKRAMDISVEQGLLLPDLYFGGAPIRGFRWLRSMEITFHHMWSPNFALLPGTLNFAIRDEIQSPFDRCEIVLKALSKRRFVHTADFADFLSERLILTKDHGFDLTKRVISSGLSKNKMELAIALNTNEIDEPDFLALLCSATDFGFLYAPIKEVVIR